MPIVSTTILDVGPLNKVTIQLDPHTNLFVGLNNTGKTAALCAIAEVAVYPFSIPVHFLAEKKPQVAVTYRTRGGGISSFASKMPVLLKEKSSRWAQYEKFLSSIGFSAYLPALRVSTDYRSEGPTQDKSQRNRLMHSTEDRHGIRIEHDAVLFHDTPRDIRLEKRPTARSKRWPGESKLMKRRLGALDTNARFVRDNDVIQRIIDLDYKQYRTKNSSLRELADLIVAVTSEITAGFAMTFAEVKEDGDGLYIALKTPYGIVPLNTLSQGTQSIFQWVSRLVLGMMAYYEDPKGLSAQPGTVLIDEVDAHLHPTWQRRIFPTLRKYFPKLQVISTAHSPLMIAGLNAGQLHLFQRETKGNISVTTNSRDIVGWTSDQVYQEFLGIENPTDLATAEITERLGQLERKRSPSRKDKEEIARLGRALLKTSIESPALTIC